MNIRKITALLLSGVLAASVLTGCGGINKDATVATLNGTPVTLGIANFAARLQQASYDDFYVAYFGENAWSSDLYGNGTTLESTTKDSVIESIQDMYTLQLHMDEYNVSLSEDEKTKIAETATEFMKANDDKAIKALGATQEIVEEYLTLVTIQSKMKAAMIVDADTNVTDKEAKTSSYSYVKISKTTHTGADGKTVEYTDDERSDLANTVKEFAKAAGKDGLDEAAKAHEYTVSNGTFTGDDTTLDAKVLEKLKGMSEGDVSGLIDTDSDYYVVRLDKELDPEATDQNRQNIISKRQTDLYNQILDGWKKESEWTLEQKVWDKVTFDNLFTTTVKNTENTEGVVQTEATESIQ